MEIRNPCDHIKEMIYYNTIRVHIDNETCWIKLQRFSSPILGGQLLAVTDWRGIFGVLPGPSGRGPAGGGGLLSVPDMAAARAGRRGDGRAGRSDARSRAERGRALFAGFERWSSLASLGALYVYVGD